MTFSMAAIPCGPPKPRIAVLDGRLVRQTVPDDGDIGDEVRIVGMEHRSLHDGQREVGRAAAVGVEVEARGPRSARPSRSRPGSATGRDAVCR